MKREERTWVRLSFLIENLYISIEKCIFASDKSLFETNGCLSVTFGCPSEDYECVSEGFGWKNIRGSQTKAIDRNNPFHSIYKSNNLEKGIAMAKYKLQEMPDMQGAGKRKVYPKMVINRTLGLENLVEKMKSYHRAFSPSAVEAVVMDLEEMLVEVLSMGYNVKLDGIGTFSLSLGFEDDKPTEMQEEGDKMLYRKVGVKNVNFKVDPEMLQQLRRKTDLERDMGGVKVIKKKLFSREERVARALEVIERDGYITLTDYANINNLCRTVASEELREITSAANSPIDWRGNGSHKVWIKKRQ